MFPGQCESMKCGCEEENEEMAKPLKGQRRRSKSEGKGERGGNMGKRKGNSQACEAGDAAGIGNGYGIEASPTTDDCTTQYSSTPATVIIHWAVCATIHSTLVIHPRALPRARLFGFGGVSLLSNP